APEVVGVVLIDSMNQEASDSAPVVLTGDAPPPPTDPQSTSRWLSTLPARIGLLRLIEGPFRLNPSWSLGAADAYTAFSVTPRSLRAWLDEGQGVAESLRLAHSIQSLGAIPLIVLSRGLVEGQDQDWQRQQTELLQLSS